MSLILELGVPYCNELMVGAFLMYKGEPHQLANIDSRTSTVLLNQVGEDGALREAVSDTLDIISSWDDLKYPTLGYREAMDGATLFYLTRRPSVRRGLHASDLRSHLHECGTHLHHLLRNSNKLYTQWRSKWQYTPNEYLSITSGKMWHAFMPRYTSLKKGLPQVLTGERPSFAMSAEFAVAPAPGKDSGLEILYRQRVIGSITDEGKISLNISNKLISGLWEEESNRG